MCSQILSFLLRCNWCKQHQRELKKRECKFCSISVTLLFSWIFLRAFSQLSSHARAIFLHIFHFIMPTQITFTLSLSVTSSSLKECSCLLMPAHTHTHTSPHKVQSRFFTVILKQSDNTKLNVYAGNRRTKTIKALLSICFVSVVIFSVKWAQNKMCCWAQR